MGMSRLTFEHQEAKGPGHVTGAVTWVSCMWARSRLVKAVAGSLACALACCQPDELCRCSECTVISGASLWALDHGGSDGICVAGDLVIRGRSREELAFAGQIREISGSLVIYDNPALDELPEWPSLTHIDGGLSISENPGISQIAQFPALAEIGGGFYLAGNANLERVELEAVVSLGSLFVALNPRLTELTGFQRLRDVEGDFRVSENIALTSVRFPALEVAGDLGLVGNVGLLDAEFPQLASIGGTWTIADNPGLADLSGFRVLAQVGENIFIIRNDRLQHIELDIEGLSGTISLSDNRRLESITGADAIELNSLTAIDILHNVALRELSGFNDVLELRGVSISDNPSLQTIEGWRRLKALSGFGLEITHNDALAGPMGLFPMLETTASLRIYENPALAPALVDGLVARVEVEARPPKVGDNKGQDTELDPCPWAGDSSCDAELTTAGGGTALCAADPGDCPE